MQVRLQNSVTTNNIDTIIKVATYFHNKFENIHVFVNGDGRVGRILTNYILMINNMPPLIVYDDEKNIRKKLRKKLIK